jgi:hypothetical protein
MAAGKDAAVPLSRAEADEEISAATVEAGSAGSGAPEAEIASREGGTEVASGAEIAGSVVVGRVTDPVPSGVEAIAARQGWAAQEHRPAAEA